MNKFIVQIFIILLLSLSQIVEAKSRYSEKQIVKKYEYVEKEHTAIDKLKLLGRVYLFTVTGYVLTQQEAISEHGSFDNYQHNFGSVVMDKDNPIWNLVGHPYVGSQYYLFYRGNGFSKIGALEMAFYSSTLFETTIEIYTEKTSIQDLYQTPVLGAALGYGLEKLSFYFLNNENLTALKVFGHILNPLTLFGYGEIETVIYPVISPKKQALNMVVTF